MTRLLLFMMLGASFLPAQMGGRPPLDRWDLTQRLAVSDIVIVGTVLRVHFFPREGVHHTIRVDEQLCQGADFRPVRRTAVLELKEVDVLQPRWDRTPWLDDPEPVEVLEPGAKYLLILSKDPDLLSNLKLLALDNRRIPYRAVDRARGAIQVERTGAPAIWEFEYAGITSPMPAPQSVALGPVVEDARVTTLVRDARALCHAVDAVDPLLRIAALEKLLASGDPEMRANADTAIRLLRGEPIL